MFQRANQVVHSWCTGPVKRAAQQPRNRMSVKASASLPDKFDLHGKNVLVTGASRGIGLEVRPVILGQWLLPSTGKPTVMYCSGITAIPNTIFKHCHGNL